MRSKVLALLLVLPATAAADGLPVLGVDAGPGGVTAPSSEHRYVTLPAREGTVVAQVERDGGAVPRSHMLRGNFSVPAVALDGSPSGLSADGGTLVLIEPRAGFPRRATTFAVLDAKRLRLREKVRLRGDFSFDALSPDGGRIYLVEYTSPRDPTQYLVRAYDVRAGRLLPDPIVDPREPDERMRGLPITRRTSPDGRWEYTLYDGAGGHPFIHALDTRDATAACIDLHGLAGYPGLMELRLALDPSGGRLVVDDRGLRLAVVDTKTFEVSQPPPSPKPQAGDDDGGLPAIPLALAGLALLAGLAAAARRRRGRAVQSSDSPSTTANTAPAGSRNTAKRPLGTSIGPNNGSPTRETTESAESTVK